MEYTRKEWQKAFEVLSVALKDRGRNPALDDLVKVMNSQPALTAIVASMNEFRSQKFLA